jgi:hypothetical protein
VLDAPPAPFAASLLAVELYNTAELVFIGSAAASLSSAEPRPAGYAASLGVACVLLAVLATYMGIATRRALEEVRTRERDRDDVELVG